MIKLSDKNVTVHKITPTEVELIVDQLDDGNTTIINLTYMDVMEMAHGMDEELNRSRR